MNLKVYFGPQHGIGPSRSPPATTALIRVGIEEAVHVGGFQRVTIWRPAP